MKILRYEDVLIEEEQPDQNMDTEVDEATGEESDEDETTVNLNSVKGRRKSGKFWKDDRKRASSNVKTRGLRMSLEKKNKLRYELKHVKELSRQVVQNRKQEKEEKRKRQEENMKRREENAKKAEVVQVIKNTAKIKRMRKKQLRSIEKRDTSAMQKK